MPLFLTKANSDNQFWASCSSSDSVGDLVKVSGNMADDLVPVTKVDPLDRSKMPAVGIIIEKTMPDLAVVQMMGFVDLSPDLTGLSPGSLCYVNTDGRPTVVPPSAVGLGVPVIWQIVGVGAGSGSLQVSPGLDMTLVRP